MRGAGAWPAAVNFTSFPDVNQIYRVYYQSINYDNNFTVIYMSTANRTLNAKILDYKCDTYFPEPTILPGDSDNRYYSRNAPAFSDSCNENLLLDVQCKIYL